MPPVTAPSEQYSIYRKAVKDESLPGYVLLEPLGQGGFGEVWKCEAPGGLHKAIKFVPGATDESTNNHQFQQEFDAFLQIKAIRHPFLLTLERVELVGNDLVMVMELADRQMRDRFEECQAAGMPGIPRDELLGYLAEAAEALDMINADYGLQHLDVKPANLFITAGHVKVGDYGLVSRLDGGANGGTPRGMTPKYVAPEVLKGTVDPRSDQYSLALVYQEMLTGTFPYAGRSPQQIMMAHVSAKPDVSPLPESDRPAVAKALSKRPDDRYPLCLDFIRALLADDGNPRPKTRSGASAIRTRALEMTPGPAERTGRHSQPGSNSGTVPIVTGSRDTSLNPTRPLPAPAAGRLLTVQSLQPSGRWPSPPVPTPAPIAEKAPEPVAPPAKIIVTPIRCVIPAARLRGDAAPELRGSARDFVQALVSTAAGGQTVPQIPGEITVLSDGNCVCQFPTTVPEAVAPLKLGVMRETCDLTMDPPENGQLIFRKTTGGGRLWGFSGKKSGLEIVVKLPPAGKNLGEVTVYSRLFGTPDRAFLQATQTAIPRMVEQVKRELGNVADRRKTPRLAAAFPLTVYPLHSDGSIDAPLNGTCRDVSVSGVGFTVPESFKARYAYLEFAGVPALAGVAILVKLIRSQQLTPAGECLYAGPFRFDL
jgi:serine/threonine protein kinase